jgi:glycosyltransferase involved in cell wall biosynthesis
VPAIKRAIARIPHLGPFLQRAYWNHLSRRRAAAGRTGGVQAPTPEVAKDPDLDLLRSIGYRFERASRPPITVPRPLPPPEWPVADFFVVTVCSMSFVPFARTLLESVRRHHGAVPFVVTVVDAPGRDAVSLPGAVVLTGRDVFAAELDYLALKVDATELCCAAKPATLDYLLRTSAAKRFVYLDSDVYLFAPMEALLSRLDGADFVVTPHVIAPLPKPERFWEMPTHLGLAHAGVFNAGIFAMRRSEESTRFVETWKWVVTAPVTTTGAEQHAFNWVSCFVEEVAVLRDTAYNVAYWNLHDRSLRYLGGDDGGAWTVDGRPLVAFHFSGFSLASPFQLSRHDNRCNLYVLPAVARLRDLYVERLQANDWGETQRSYGFDRFPSGIRIDALMRLIFREHEVFLRAEVSPWTPEGEAVYARALLSPVPYTMSLAPILVKKIYDQRPDLRAMGDITVDPRPFIHWMASAGVGEYHYEELLDRHRPVVPSYFGAVLLTALGRRRPGVFANLRDAVGADRRELLSRLETVAPYEALLVREGATEQWITSRVGALRQFVSQRPDVLAAFPDFFFDDAPAFVAWLREKRLREHFLPEDAIDAFATRAGGRSLARIFSYVSRTWPMMDAWPLGLAGEDSVGLARGLLFGLLDTIEYELEDVEMFLWIMETMPWAGVPLTLELPIHSTRHPSSRSRRGQQEILAPLLVRDRRYGAALDRYRRRYPPVIDEAPPSRRSTRDVLAFSAVGAERSSEPHRRPPRRVAPGVNVFGYHRSEIGLGQMTRGLVGALGTIGCPTSEAVLANVRMDDDLLPEDFIRTYDVAKGTNIFVSYVHLHERLIRTIPDEVVAGHRNVIYLAWEQRGGTHYWRDAYAEYDQVWALSDFAADSLGEVMQRPVHSLPCVVDVTSFPPPSSKSRHGLDPRAFTFLFVFDANSSTERKNPEAVVRAFRRAFRGDDRARLVIKVSSGDRMGNRARLQRLLGLIGGDPTIEVRVEYLNRGDLYGLISAADCYVSLHRSEGFGYTCAEAMVYGKPVIATAYSGNMQFMNARNSYPVDCREVEADVQEGPFQRGSLWAEPNVEHAAALMRQVYEDPVEAAARGALGRRTIAEELSPAAIGERVRTLLGAGVVGEPVHPPRRAHEAVIGGTHYALPAAGAGATERR